MKWPADYHMHTPLCRHATGEPTAYAAQALKVGLNEIGFTDHSPMERDDFDDWRMRNDQLDEYVEKVKQARRDHPKLQIKLGLEVDYLPGQEEWIRDLARRHPWDYLIGSVHYISNDWAVDNPHQMSRWKERDPFEVWAAYFDRLIRAAQMDLFQIIAHVDLPKKFGIIPERDCSPLMRSFLYEAHRHHCAVELNTAGLHKQCREIYPSALFAGLIKEYQVPITFGSDAHAPDEVGRDFDQALALARACGFTHWLCFTRGKSKPVALD